MKAILILGLMTFPAATQAASCHIALDVGHSISHPGATSARGQAEWRFNQQLAIEIGKTLDAAGLAVHVVNPDGGDMGLKARSQSAARAGADLLLSIHHDAVQPRYLENWIWQGRQQRFSDRFHGFGLFVSPKNRHYQSSRQLAALLADSLLAAQLTPSLHHAEPIPGEGLALADAERGIYDYPDLAVVKYAPMPAVLMEAGIIVNRDEETRLNSPEFRAGFAQAVGTAVQRFCHSLRRY